jgi:hypothetical protein
VAEAYAFLGAAVREAQIKGGNIYRTTLEIEPEGFKVVCCRMGADGGVVGALTTSLDFDTVIQNPNMLLLEMGRTTGELMRALSEREHRRAS